MNKLLLLLSATLIILTMSCSPKLNVPDSYIMTKAGLLDTLKKTDKNLVLFYTDWCPASKWRVENHYKPLIEKVKKENLNLNLIMLASDQNISTKQIDEIRALGITCYYIQKPGANALANRAAIKKFINTTFPDNEVTRIQKFQYGIPVELLITNDLKILNEKESIVSYNYVKELLGLKK